MFLDLERNLDQNLGAKPIIFWKYPDQIMDSKTRTKGAGMGV